jgi:hypothetical protein
VNCWHCERPGHAVCFFCGRVVCRDHRRSLPHLLAVYRSSAGVLRGLAVPAATHCGVCEPRDAPVDLEGLD